MLIIFVGGACAAGKTEFTTLLLEELRDQGISATLLAMDHYYNICPPEITPEAFRKQSNFANPKSMRWNRLRDDLKCLSQGQAITTPLYNMIESAVTTEVEMVPCEVLIVEGMLALSLAKGLKRQIKNESLIEPNILNILLDATSEDIMDRRYIRDMLHRNRTKELVDEHERLYFRNEYEKQIKPFKHTTDIYVKNSKINETPLDHMPNALTTKRDDPRHRILHANVSSITTRIVHQNKKPLERFMSDTTPNSVQSLADSRFSIFNNIKQKIDDDFSDMALFRQN